MKKTQQFNVIETEMVEGGESRSPLSEEMLFNLNLSEKT